TATNDEPTPFASPYLNTRPGVQYVGDKVCADCHDVGQSYKHHPMGRSAAFVAKAQPWESLDKNGASSFEALGSRFTVQRRGGKVLHKETYRAQGRVIGELEEEVALAIGSGRQGRSFLINRDGWLFQSPISWYAPKPAGWGQGSVFEKDRTTRPQNHA